MLDCTLFFKTKLVVLFLICFPQFDKGASLITLLAKAQNSPRSILAIKTIDGNIFGAFTSSLWHDKGNSFYGSGESFLWRSNYDIDEYCDD